MAEGKKSFVLYCDLISTVSKLPNDKAGELFKLILEYVNDKNPIIENDLLLEVSFEPIKLQLKRDLKKWDDFRQKQSNNGKLGGRPKANDKPNNPSLLEESQKSLNVTVNVNDTVNVKKDIGDKSPSLEERKENFRKSLIPFLGEYGKEMLRAFFDYWSESNEGGKKMLFEMKKTFNLKLRLTNWKAKENDFKKPSEKKSIAIKPKINNDYIES